LLAGRAWLPTPGPGVGAPPPWAQASPHGGDRRHVFTWRKDDLTRGMRWHIPCSLQRVWTRPRDCVQVASINREGVINREEEAWYVAQREALDGEQHGCLGRSWVGVGSGSDADAQADASHCACSAAGAGGRFGRGNGQEGGPDRGYRSGRDGLVRPDQENTLGYYRHAGPSLWPAGHTHGR